MTPNLATAETPFFGPQQRPQLSFTPTSGANAMIPKRSESRLLNLEAHHLALAITRKSMDENCFRTAQKTTDREPPSFKIGNRVYFKNKQPRKWHLKWRPGYQTVHIEHDGLYLYIENQATGKTRSCNNKDVLLKPPVELCNINMQFDRAGRYINHPMNLQTITLTN